VVVLLFFGCEDDFQYDVTLANKSGESLGIHLSGSPGWPSQYRTLLNNASYTYTDIQEGRQYIFVTDNFDEWRFDLDIVYDTSYDIKWNNGAIVLIY
jgi:hypothetical protein